MNRLLLAVGLCGTCAAYAPIGRPRPRRGLVVRRAEDRAEQIKKLNDMFYGTSTTTTTDVADDASTDSSAADASNPLADLPLWRVPVSYTHLTLPTILLV